MNNTELFVAACENLSKIARKDTNSGKILHCSTKKTIQVIEEMRRDGKVDDTEDNVSSAVDYAFEKYGVGDALMVLHSIDVVAQDLADNMFDSDDPRDIISAVNGSIDPALKEHSNGLAFALDQATNNWCLAIPSKGCADLSDEEKMAVVLAVMEAVSDNLGISLDDEEEDR